MKTYLLLHHKIDMRRRMVDQQAVLDAVDSLPSVANWRAEGDFIFLVSDEEGRDLYEKIREKLPALSFFITPVDYGSAWGYLNERTWQFIKQPKAVADT